MNCDSVRARLPELLYGDLEPEVAATLRQHLEACVTCRGEEATLRQVRRLLDGAPIPEVSVNLAEVYRKASERNDRHFRRWRRAAVLLVGAAAAVVAFAVLPRFELRLDDHQVVLRWASPPADVPAPLPPSHQADPGDRSEASRSTAMDEQVQVLSELLQGQQEEIAQLQTEVVHLRRQVAAAAQRWLTTERDIAALSGSQSIAPKRGNVHE
jgi:hypothetical protein